MLKSRLFMAVAAGVLLGATGVASADSVFPRSVNETGPAHLSLTDGKVGYESGRTHAVMPRNLPHTVSESRPALTPRAARAQAYASVGATGSTGAMGRIESGTASRWPASPNETGPNLY